MKDKKIISLMLCILVMISCVVGCGASASDDVSQVDGSVFQTELETASFPDENLMKAFKSSVETVLEDMKSNGYDIDVYVICCDSRYNDFEGVDFEYDYFTSNLKTEFEKDGTYKIGVWAMTLIDGNIKEIIYANDYKSKDMWIIDKDENISQCPEDYDQTFEEMLTIECDDNTQTSESTSTSIVETTINKDVSKINLNTTQSIDTGLGIKAEDFEDIFNKRVEGLFFSLNDNTYKAWKNNSNKNNHDRIYYTITEGLTEVDVNNPEELTSNMIEKYNLTKIESIADDTLISSYYEKCLPIHWHINNDGYIDYISVHAASSDVPIFLSLNNSNDYEKFAIFLAPLKLNDNEFDNYKKIIDYFFKMFQNTTPEQDETGMIITYTQTIDNITYTYRVDSSKNVGNLTISTLK